MNRRNFLSMMAAASAALSARTSLAGGLGLKGDSEEKGAPSGGFPAAEYTPFGYLDNPWHSWDLHPSGVLRSVPGIGMGLYYPAGPGGYFDYQRNGVYSAELSLSFRVGAQVLETAEAYARQGLHSPHHSKNILSYLFTEEGVRVTSWLFQPGEHALAALVRVEETGGRGQRVRVLAAQKYALGGSKWWGGDGLAGDFAAEADSLWMHSFAAGTVFTLAGDKRSVGRFLSAEPADAATWWESEGRQGSKTSYDKAPLTGGLLYELKLEPHATSELLIVMARGNNLAASGREARSALRGARRALAQKRLEDDRFWSEAPTLTGDWPEHWKHGWVYDFETLRTMVRNPTGEYKHPWDAMQIQAPRSVLAETSIDMWALSYANPELAKAVFLGQFLDALSPNIPCMREDGVMNMVAADGSECGTSISWCFPFFCAASIFDRTRDVAWLRRLYNGLAALLDWTLTHRVDRGGFVVGKCSWETGMDTSKRFLIEQPTGGEVVDFLRLVELQAAAAQAGATLARFAALTGNDKDVVRWRQIEERYAAKTRELWGDDWFHDYDTRKHQLVTTAQRDPSQAAPVFCGVASQEQSKQMIATLRAMYDSMKKQGAGSVENALNWSSFVLPFLESAWCAGDRELASLTTADICERIYASMDRRSVASPAKEGQLKLGWPGVSCEIWGAHGAIGGEVYGWGAVMPAHLLRNLAGFRESEHADRFTLSPGLPQEFIAQGKEYGVARLSYGQQRIGLGYKVVEAQRLAVTLQFSSPPGVVAVTDDAGKAVTLRRAGGAVHFEIQNFDRVTVHLRSA